MVNLLHQKSNSPNKLEYLFQSALNYHLTWVQIMAGVIKLFRLILTTKCCVWGL